jgi:ribosomal protein L15E
MASRARRSPARSEPWERRRPVTKKTTLALRRKRAAKAAAARAGRRYPNLVDNMREAAKQKASRRKG